MITPRRTRLTRVRSLHAFRQAIVDLTVTSGESVVASGFSRTILILPNLAAAQQIRRRFAGGAIPILSTRDGLYDALHARLTDPPRRLSPYEREAIARAAAREASRSTLESAPLDPPERSSEPRPGYVAGLLRFYDQLRRQGQQVDRFEELLCDTLEREAEYDRGAERMLRQTRRLSLFPRPAEKS